jgi:membrane protein DedA with SNARE-associated domain
MAAVFGFSTAVAFVLTYSGDFITRFGNWGYLGVFFVQVMNSATIILPAPGHAYTFVIGNALNPLIIGVAGGLGASIGELTGYLLGSTGRQVLVGGRWYGRFESVANRWAGPALFAFAAIPLPFDVAGVWAGAVRYPIWKFLVLVGAGKIIKVTMIAGAGYFSLPYLVRLVA